MKDGVPKGTGNSRFLKSAISTATTWEQFRTMLVNGTLPIDLGGVNAAGWQVQGDALNKANLLPDSVATALGLSGNPQVKDALGAIGNRIQIDIGYYTGTGTYGASNPVRRTFSFQPKLFLIVGFQSNGRYVYNMAGLWLKGLSEFLSLYESNALVQNVSVSLSNKTLSWYSQFVDQQFNTANARYDYYALG